MKKHVTRLFLAWLDDSGTDTRSIMEHLERCASCRKYYDKMSLLLAQTNLPVKSMLEPDPYLPVRIGAIAAARNQTFPNKVLLTTRLSLAGLVVALGVAVGVSLGKAISPRSTHYGKEDMVSIYSSAISQESFTSGLESIIETTKEKHQ